METRKTVKWLMNGYSSVLFYFVCGAIGSCLLIASGGCARVPVHKQRLVAKHNMQFSDSKIFDYSNPLQDQVEPASAGAGSAKSSGCTSCN